MSTNNHRLCHRYDEISTKVYGSPANTQELVELVEYVKEVSTVTFYQMNDEVKAAARRLLTLLDYANFSGMWIECLSCFIAQFLEFTEKEH